MVVMLRILRSSSASVNVVRVRGREVADNGANVAPERPKLPRTAADRSCHVPIVNVKTCAPQEDHLSSNGALFRQPGLP